MTVTTTEDTALDLLRADAEQAAPILDAARTPAGLVKLTVATHHDAELVAAHLGQREPIPGADAYGFGYPVRELADGTVIGIPVLVLAVGP